MTTKEKIIDEALTLFSIRGYSGTSVKNIADAVGIKDSSLYKHFKSKKEIFDTIVAEMEKRMETMSAGYGLPDESRFDDAAALYGSFTEEGIVQLSKKIFLFYLKDAFMCRFWRMSNIEQYRNEEIYKIYREIFMERSIEYQTKLFEEMIKRGIFVKTDPQAMAISFYAPIFFLLSKYNSEPEREAEALELLEKQVKEFSRVYRASAPI